MGYRRCKHEPPGPPKTYVLLDMEYQGPDYTDWWAYGTCEYGHCVTLNCPVCGCNSGGGWGPVLCPCDDTVAYHDMRRRPKIPVKPGISTRRRRPNRKVK